MAINFEQFEFTDAISMLLIAIDLSLHFIYKQKETTGKRDPFAYLVERNVVIEKNLKRNGGRTCKRGWNT